MRTTDRTNIRKLTKSIVDNLKPGDKPYIAYCPSLPGFGVRVLTSGRMVYIARYRTLAGVERLQTIARTTDMPIEAAKFEAVSLFEASRKGRDPSEERRAVRASERLSDVFDNYQRETAAFRKPKTVEFNAAQWKHLNPRFGRLNVRAIMPGMIRDFMIDYAGRKPTANNSLSVLRKLLNFAKVVPNPCTDVKPYPIERPFRVLTIEELRRIDTELDTFTDWFALLIRLLVLTGGRLREIMSVETAWVNLEMQTLSLPRTHSKAGARIIHLPVAACELLRGCHTRKYVIMEPWADYPLKQPYVSWKKLCKVCGLQGVRIHDLRHTYGSKAHRAGLSQREIATLLGHRQLRTTERYLHLIPDNAISPVEIAATAMSMEKPR